MVYVLGVLVVLAGVWGARALSRQRRRAGLLASALTARERAIVARMVPLVTRMPDDVRPRFEGKMCLFLDQVTFYGCNGLEITEEMELSIAAQACLLVANTEAWYHTLRTVLVYPGAFRSRQVEHEGFVVTEGEAIRSGESWARGPVILSWAHTEAGAANPDDGHNVVIHEFAHQLDELSGQTDAVPVLAPDQSFAEWARVFLDAFERHVANTEAGRKTVLDAYGATQHVEFFAVAVEVFFEQPEALKRQEPEVYDQLSRLMRLDPVAWG